MRRGSAWSFPKQYSVLGGGDRGLQVDPDVKRSSREWLRLNASQVFLLYFLFKLQVIKLPFVLLIL